MMSRKLLPAVAGCLTGVLLMVSAALRADDLASITALFRQGDHVAALERVNVYLDAKPKDVEARFLKGLILTEQKNYPEATEVFVSLTEDNPALPEPYNNLAVVYAAQGKYEMARIQLQTALKANPAYATAHENLGDVYARLASQSYGNALQLDGANASARVKLSLLQGLFSREGAEDARPPADPNAAPAQ